LPSQSLHGLHHGPPDTSAAFDKQKTVAENRRARYEYFIEDKFEAGIMLTGTEVKSLRFGEGSIAEAMPR
jgi:SsrA-binding protein